MCYQQKESIYGGSWGRFFFHVFTQDPKSSIHTIACDSWQLEWILCFSVPQFAPDGQVKRCCLADFGWSYSSSWPIPAAWIQDFERCEAAVKDNPVFGQWGCEDVLAMFWPRSMPQLFLFELCARIACVTLLLQMQCHRHVWKMVSHRWCENNCVLLRFFASFYMKTQGRVGDVACPFWVEKCTKRIWIKMYMCWRGSLGLTSNLNELSTMFDNWFHYIFFMI